MEALFKDLRYGLRTLARSPGFTAVAVLTLALGIGANTAIFSVVNAVLLRPLPYAAPERLVYIHSEFTGMGLDKFWVSPAEYRELQEHSRSFSSIGAWTISNNANLSGIETPIRATVAWASAEIFPTLGVPPQLGRTYTVEEDVPDAEWAITISHRLWSSVFGADPEILGSQIEVNGISRTVVGVMPPGFDIQDAGVDLWMPLRLSPDLAAQRARHFLHVVGRLAPGVTLEQAQMELRSLVARWEEIAGGQHAPGEGHGMFAVSFHEEMVGGARTMLLLLLGVVGFILLIACANVGNLLLIRAEARQKEVAIRAALGAGRFRLARQFLTEAMTLSLAGGIAGLLAGYWALRLLLHLRPEGIPRLDAIGLDATVLAFTLGITILTGLIFGLAPLLHLAPRAMGMTLKEGGGRTTAGAARKHVRHSLVVAQLALAVVLVIGSGLMLRSFAALQEVDPGFRPAGLLTFQLFLPGTSYQGGMARAAFYDRLFERLEAVPGVSGVTAMRGLPPVREVDATDVIFEGREGPEGPTQSVDYMEAVFAGYFATMGIPILEGRAFTRGDDGEATPVVVINERLASLVYPGENPLGQRITTPSASYTIVGVAGNVHQGGLDEQPGTELYFHYPQTAALGGLSPLSMNLVVRTEVPPMALAPEIRQAVREVDAALPIANLQTMEQTLAASVRQPRFLAFLLTLFASVALSLAAVGTFGVLSYMVAQRRREIGIRKALGAGRAALQGMVLRQGSVLAALGLALGLLGAFALTRLMSGLLFGVSETDPLTFFLAPAVLAAVALAACYLPARRATRVDPMITLRAE